MTWVKIDDGLPDHPKVVGLTDAAFRLYVSGLCYASRNLTDGFIPNQMVARLGAHDAHALELVDACLWDICDDKGFSVHDYLAHQSSREQVETAKAANRERVARHKAKKAVNAVANAISNAVGNAEVIDPETETETETEPLLPVVAVSPTADEAAVIPLPRSHSARSAVERISDRLMEARSQGVNAWNLSRLVEDEWDELHAANDIGGCIALTAWYVSELQSRTLSSPEIARIGQMTKRFGRIALLAIDEAASKDLTDLVSYAFRIAQSMYAQKKA